MAVAVTELVVSGGGCFPSRVWTVDVPQVVGLIDGVFTHREEAKCVFDWPLTIEAALGGSDAIAIVGIT